jgi:DNA-binding beta-propeller fold protein YncE
VGTVALALALLVVSGTFAALPVPVPQSAQASGASTASGPIAISMLTNAEAIVLDADGRVTALDVVEGVVGAETYRVPPAFEALDAAAAMSPNGPVMSFTVNRRGSDSSSFVLQVMRDKREVWLSLPMKGLYVGIAMDPVSGVAYVTNASLNAVYRVPLGSEKAVVTEVATLAQAQRAGALALDTVGRRLFVADMDKALLHIVSLDGTKGNRSIPLGKIEEVRAVAWSSRDRRVYLADAAQETVWSLEPDAAAPQLQPTFKDKRFKEPAGLTVAADGTLWMVDEGARSAFQLSLGDRRILREIEWRRGRR